MVLSILMMVTTWAVIVSMMRVQRVRPIFPAVIKMITQQFLLAIRRQISPHDLCPPLHFLVIKQTAIEEFRNGFHVYACAYKDNFLSSVTPFALEVFLDDIVDLFAW